MCTKIRTRSDMVRTRSVSVKGSDTFGSVMSVRTSKILLKNLSERDLTERPNRPHPPLVGSLGRKLRHVSSLSRQLRFTLFKKGSCTLF